MTDTAAMIDAYIARLSRQLTVATATRDMILEEVRSHLDETIAHAVADGITLPIAEAQALAAFGSATQVAARYNDVHLIAWDARRFGSGILWGIGLSWLIWTTVAFPFVVQQAIQFHAAFPNASVAAPGALLFSATPLAFGLVRALASDGLWIVVLLLLLFGVVPFLWGWRAQRGWQPGLAFGLGVVIGFPWLLPGLIYYWGNSPGSPLAGLVIVFCIWLLCPFAMLMSWSGHRLAAARVGRIAIKVVGSCGQRHLRRYRHAVPYVLFSVVLVALVAINVWSWQRTAQLVPTPVAQQLATAQANLSFSLRQPTYLPPHVALKTVTVATVDHIAGGCSQCYVTLAYQGDNGDGITLNEWQFPPSAPSLPPGLAPPLSGYAIENASGGETDPIWWLGIDTKQTYEINVTWMHNGVSYSLWSQSASQAAFSAALLQQVAASV